MVEKNFQMIDFFDFLKNQKCAKSYLNIIYGLETGFKHFGSEFDAIFMIYTSFKRILKKSIF